MSQPDAWRCFKDVRLQPDHVSFQPHETACFVCSHNSAAGRVGASASAYLVLSRVLIVVIASLLQHTRSSSCCNRATGLSCPLKVWTIPNVSCSY